MKKLLIIVILVVVIGGLYWWIKKNEVTMPPVDGGNSGSCTMDAMQCPDGSYVGRVAPSCEFAACPSTLGVDTKPGESDIVKILNLDPEDPNTSISQIMRGHLDDDEREDAVVIIRSCGGSCSYVPLVILNTVSGMKNIGYIAQPQGLDSRYAKVVGIYEMIVSVDYSSLDGRVLHTGKYRVENGKIVSLP